DHGISALAGSGFLGLPVAARDEEVGGHVHRGLDRGARASVVITRRAPHDRDHDRHEPQRDPPHDPSAFRNARISSLILAKWWSSCSATKKKRSTMDIG